MTKVDLRLYVEGSISVGKRIVCLVGRTAWREAPRNIFHLSMYSTHPVWKVLSLRTLYALSIEFVQMTK